MKKSLLAISLAVALVLLWAVPALAQPPVGEPCPCGHDLCTQQNRGHPTCEPQYEPHNWFNKWCFAKACNENNNDKAGHWPPGHSDPLHHVPMPQNEECAH